ncbi:uncharacterized protein [Oscarella lobularis]|uniref:uncharacterized protein n=1 Tax=Oscarella lobularis TaxID=121494 RepID=UPI003313A4A1
MSGEPSTNASSARREISELLQNAVEWIHSILASFPMHCYKFVSMNVCSAELSQASSAFHFEKNETIPLFGTDGVFETPTKDFFLKLDADALDRLHDATRPKFLQTYSRNVLNAGGEKEHEKELRVLRELIGPLCGGKCLVSTHGKPPSTTRQYTGVFEPANLGIGNYNTWHGFLDAVAKPGGSLSEVILSLSLSDRNEEESSAEPSSDNEESSAGKATRQLSHSSDGDGCPLEFKLKVSEKGLSQAAAEAIVYSFVHHNRHPSQSSLVPNLLLDDKSFYIVMYDCVADVLLISDEVMIVSDQTHMNHILLLWMILHHKVILKTTEHYKNLKSFCSGFREECTRCKWLSHYESLQDYDQISIPKKQP